VSTGAGERLLARAPVGEAMGLDARLSDE